MPKIPSVEQQVSATPQLDAPSIIPARNLEAAQLANLGESEVRLGGELFGVAEHLQEGVDEARSLQGRNALNEVYRREMEDPETGYLNRIGESAISSLNHNRKNAFDSMVKERARIEASMKTPRQRFLFGRAADQMFEQQLWRADSHEATQTQNYLKGQHAAAMKQYGIQAVEAGDPRGRELAFRLMRISNDRLAELGGWSDQERDNSYNAMASDVHQSIVGKMLDSQDPQRTQNAKGYLKDVPKGELDPGVRQKLDRIINTASEDDEAFRIFRTEQKSDRSQLDQLESVRAQVESGKITVAVGEKATRLLNASFDEEHQLRARARVDSLTKAEEFAKANRSTPPQDMMMRLPRDVRTALIESGGDEAFQLWVDQGGQYITTNAGMHALLTLSPSRLRVIKTPEQLVNTYRTEMSDAHMDQLLRRWAEANGKPVGTHTTEGSINDMVMIEMQNMELLPTFTDEQAEPETSAFNRRFLQRVQYETIRRSRILSGGATLTEENARQAFKEALDNIVMVEIAGEERRATFGALTPAERKDAFFRTPSGDIEITELRKNWKRAVEDLRRENLLREAGGEAPLEASDQNIAEVFAQAEIRRRVEEAKRNEAIRKENERLKQIHGESEKKFYAPRRTMTDTFGSPWGR